MNDTCPICRAVLPAKCGACEENQKFAREMQATQERRRSSRASTDDDDHDDAQNGDGVLSAVASEAAVSEAAAVAETAVAEAVATASAAALSVRV